MKQDEDKKAEFSTGERLILMMLCDLYKRLQVNGDIDANFVERAISYGHYWAIKWELPGVFTPEDNEQTVREVADILTMWEFIELGYSFLSDEEKELVNKETNKSAEHIRFRGFEPPRESRRPVGLSHAALHDRLLSS